MLHPYYQTHHNRLCAPQQMGWGEGLEKVADYLNRQPGSDDLIVTSFYGCVLKWFFRGRVVDLGELTRRVKPDYVVFYNSQVTRYLFPVIIGKYFLNANHRPEYTARLNGIPYAWVYRTEFFDSNRPMRWLNE